MKTQVKICGLTRAEDVAGAEAAGADFLGFIVEVKSKRRLSVAQAAALIKTVKTNTVAVTGDPSDQLVADIKAAGFSHIQLHGWETLARVAEIARTGLSVIKAVPVDSRDEVALATDFSGAADLILFDAKPAPDAPKDAPRGGHGLTFDWSILKGAAMPKRWALAGGLTPNTVAKAIRRTKAPIVDVASGVEISPGIKDAALIQAFIANAKDTYGNG
jgi:phosphoribosylanthranilate isomerase